MYKLYHHELMEHPINKINKVFKHFTQMENGYY